MRIAVEIVRKSAATVFVDDVEVASNPSSRIFRPQPVQVQLRFEFGRRAFFERLKNGFEREADARHCCGNIHGEDRLEKVFRLRLPDRGLPQACLLYTSDAADERSSVDLGGRRIIKK